MQRRRILTLIGAIMLVVLIALFVIYGIPFIQDLNATPIPGLPTTAAVNGGNSLQARFTETAAARKAASSAATAIPATP